MSTSLQMGIGRHMVPIPDFIWHRQPGNIADLTFMGPDHHRVRNFVVTELPRAGGPITPETIAHDLALPVKEVVFLLADLEAHLTFLFRNAQGAVTWAYPVTVDQTPHRMVFSSGERINAA